LTWFADKNLNKNFSCVGFVILFADIIVNVIDMKANPSESAGISVFIISVHLDQRQVERNLPH